MEHLSRIPELNKVLVVSGQLRLSGDIFQVFSAYFSMLSMLRNLAAMLERV